jgi:hypothetical protein
VEHGILIKNMAGGRSTSYTLVLDGPIGEPER